jgi:hypothetical protein
MQAAPEADGSMLRVSDEAPLVSESGPVIELAQAILALCHCAAMGQAHINTLF